jgi:hypothetical protein
MKLTKDECRLLGVILDEGKFDFVQSLRKIPNGTFEVLRKLELKLDEASRDKRREGRTSQNDFMDLIKRLIKKDQDGK